MRRKGVAKGGPDEKQRRDFTASEADAEGNNGEKEFPSPRADVDFRGGKQGGQDDGVRAISQDPETEVVGSVC